MLRLPSREALHLCWRNLGPLKQPVHLGRGNLPLETVFMWASDAILMLWSRPGAPQDRRPWWAGGLAGCRSGCQGPGAGQL